MLATIGDAIKARLEGLNLFKAVENGFSKRALQSPPSAVFFLSSDTIATDTPSPTRRLIWEVVFLVSYIDPVKGQGTMNEILDAVRPAFTRWQAVPVGCLPSSVPRIRFEGTEETLLIYSAQITMDVFPETIGN